MKDYSKGKIYTIRNKNDNNLIYVGSTIETLTSRMSKHSIQSLRKCNKAPINAMGIH